MNGFPKDYWERCRFDRQSFFQPAGGRGEHKMKNEKLIKEAFEAVNSTIEMLIDMKANEPWISFYIGKAWAYLDLIMNENAEEENEQKS